MQTPFTQSDTCYSFELNAGSFLTRATPRAHSFFNRVVEYHQANATYEHQMSEQDCMRDILFKSAFLEDKFIMLPLRAAGYLTKRRPSRCSLNRGT